MEINSISLRKLGFETAWVWARNGLFLRKRKWRWEVPDPEDIGWYRWINILNNIIHWKQLHLLWRPVLWGYPVLNPRESAHQLFQLLTWSRGANHDDNSRFNDMNYILTWQLHNYQMSVKESLSTQWCKSESDHMMLSHTAWAPKLR